MPRPTTDAAFPGPGSAVRAARPPAYRDQEDVEAPPRRLSKEEAEALSRREPALSPWRVVLAQLVVGAVAASIAGALGGKAAAMSALYGAAVVALPGALVARSATSRLTAGSPMASTASLLFWGFMKMIVSVVMLAAASRVVPGLVWPAMLAALFITMQTYWFALLWRGRAQ